MKKLVLCSFPVLAFSIMAFAASTGTGVLKLSESLYQIAPNNTVTDADKMVIKDQIAQVYNLDPASITSETRFDMIHTAAGVQIFKERIDIIDFEKVLWEEKATAATPYPAQIETITRILSRYE